MDDLELLGVLRFEASRSLFLARCFLEYLAVQLSSSFAWRSLDFERVFTSGATHLNYYVARIALPLDNLMFDIQFLSPSSTH